MIVTASDKGKFVLLILLAALGIVLFLPLGAITRPTPVLWLPIAVTASAYAVFVAIYSDRAIAAIHITLTPDTLRLQKGVWFCKETVVSLAAIRSVESMVSPLQNAFGCKTVRVHFAGGAEYLPLLSREDAVYITAYLQKGECS